MNGINLKANSANTITLYPSFDSSVSFQSTGEDKELYESICELNGDTSYNSDISLVLDIMTISCTYPDVASINITSDKDFDEEHVAGTSLNECINITFESAYQYIHSSYSEQAWREQTQTKPLSEITATELLLNTRFREFNFASEPTTPGVHTITITLITNEGQEFTDSVEVEFN